MKRFKNILFVKNADSNEAALVYALALVKNNEASLTLLDT